ncbi:hypothetical protein [Phenylobacterium sp.]|uniref:hypothetical protein n=1 Tax=Phenylobacterium sp. TaxID=1871053 RepID=UPI00122A9FBE|nr:hypothetical protein [Phenylobacterium sp.]THD63691.1 MAG: hypothetical protein E8A49_04870 [Phenylobacterium sp.]
MSERTTKGLGKALESVRGRSVLFGLAAIAILIVAVLVTVGFKHDQPMTTSLVTSASATLAASGSGQ